MLRSAMSPYVRTSLVWKLRFLLGGWLQKIVWRVLDPHDTWMIEYRDKKGVPFAIARTGFYSTARACAREVSGKITGHSVTSIPAGPVGDDDREMT